MGLCDTRCPYRMIVTGNTDLWLRITGALKIDNFLKSRIVFDETLKFVKSELK